MKRAAQRDFFEGKREDGAYRTKHGGGIEKNKRKLARPFRSNKPLHIVMKSSHAKGSRSLLAMQNKLVVHAIIEKHAKRVSAKIHAQQNVGNHCHLLMTFKNKDSLTKFLKAVTALIARHVTKARKGKPAGIKFWDEIPFSRVVTGLRDFRGLLSYILKNKIEADHGSAAREKIEEAERAEARMRRRRS